MADKTNVQPPICGMVSAAEDAALSHPAPEKHVAVAKIVRAASDEKPGLVAEYLGGPRLPYGTLLYTYSPETNVGGKLSLCRECAGKGKVIYDGDCYEDCETCKGDRFVPAPSPQANTTGIEPDGWICEDEFSLEPDQYDAWREEGLEPKPFYFNPPSPSQHVQCERCQGNGEIVTDWERYRHPRKGDVGDEAVAECPDCNGEGKAPPSPSTKTLVASARPDCSALADDRPEALSLSPDLAHHSACAHGLLPQLSSQSPGVLNSIGKLIAKACQFGVHKQHPVSVDGEQTEERKVAAQQAPTNDPAPEVNLGESFQERVHPWMMACFGEEISADKLERGDRLLEEVFELLQSGDYPRERVRALENYTWSREKGDPHQEAGGVMVTFAAYCLAHGLDMHAAGEDELARIWTMVDKIRAKQATKPTGSALPIATTEGSTS